MKRKQFLLIAAIILFLAGGTVVAFTYFSPGDALLHSTQNDKTVGGQFVSLPLGNPRQLASDPKPLPTYLEKSIVWAPVLNSAMAGNSLELAQANGIQVDSLKLAASQRYQRSNVDASGEAKTDKSAGVALYSLSSSQRTNTVMRKKAEKQLEGYTPATPAQPDIQNELEKKGVAKEEAQALSEAYVAYDAAAKQMVRDDVLSGFGNNGGEEFLSYMMTSESYVTAHDKQWDAWHTKMSGLFEKIQNPDGSWSGHHCITSPVFCTAAVIMTLTPDRDILLAETVAAAGK